MIRLPHSVSFLFAGAAAIVGCTTEPVPRSTWRADDGGFVSPIPLPVDDIGDDDCAEQVITESDDEDDVYSVNGEDLVDLGIFHIHKGVEHTGLGDGCEDCDAIGEGHIVLGEAQCRADVEEDHPVHDEAWGDAMLERCAKAVLSFAVCHDAQGVGTNIVPVDTILEDLGDESRVCYNFGGPTGKHAGHPAMVQWIHALDACVQIDPNLLSEEWNPCAVKFGKTAKPFEAGGDTPLCGYIDEDECDDCGAAHQRCCDPELDGDAGFFWWILDTFPGVDPTSTGGCDPTAGLTCEAGRCWPPPPPPPCGGLGQRCCGAEDHEWHAFMPDSDGCNFLDGLTCIDGTCIGISDPPGDTDDATDATGDADTSGGSTTGGTEPFGDAEPIDDAEPVYVPDVAR